MKTTPPHSADLNQWNPAAFGNIPWIRAATPVHMGNPPMVGHGVVAPLPPLWLGKSGSPDWITIRHSRVTEKPRVLALWPLSADFAARDFRTFRAYLMETCF